MLSGVREYNYGDGTLKLIVFSFAGRENQVYGSVTAEGPSDHFLLLLGLHVCHGGASRQRHRGGGLLHVRDLHSPVYHRRCPGLLSNMLHLLHAYGSRRGNG